MNKNQDFNKMYNDILELKTRYRQELDNELECISQIDSKDIVYNEWRDRFVDVISHFYKILDMHYDITFLNVEYDIYKENYFMLLCYYKYNHWKSSKINMFGNGGLKIDKTDGINSVRSKMMRAIDEELLPILDEFKIIDNYKDIEPLVLKLKERYVLKCLFCATNVEDIKEEFRNKINEEIDKYNQRIEILSNLIDYCVGYYGCYFSFIFELYDNLLDEEKFYNIYEQKVTIKLKVKRKIKRKAKNKKHW